MYTMTISDNYRIYTIIILTISTCLFIYEITRFLFLPKIIFSSFDGFVSPLSSSPLSLEIIGKDQGMVGELGYISFPLLHQNMVTHRRMNELANYNKSDIFLRQALNYVKNTKKEKISSKNIHRSIHSIEALYQGYGTHYVDLWVGSPPQRQTVIVDTGSGVTAFPCQECSEQCGEGYHVDKIFNGTASETFHTLSCHEGCFASGSCRDDLCIESVRYQEGSHWTAFQARDLLYVGGPHDFPINKNTNFLSAINEEDPYAAIEFRFSLTFGCQTKISGLFITQLADGIMGMSNYIGSFWNQMYKANVISEPSFSLCFSHNSEMKKSGSYGGAMTMGGTDTRLHSTPMIYMKASVDKGTMHGIYLRKIYLIVGGVSQFKDIIQNNTIQIDVTTKKLQGKGVIIDSGTTDTYLSSNIKSEFNSIWMKIFGTPYNVNGMRFKEKDTTKLPTILFQIVGASKSNPLFDPLDPDLTPGLSGRIDSIYPNDVFLLMPPSHYISYDSENNIYMPRVYLSESGHSVIGANAMNGHDILFETNFKQRIGIAMSECNYEKFLHNAPSKFEVQWSTYTSNLTKVSYPTITSITSQEQKKFNTTFIFVTLIFAIALVLYIIVHQKTNNTNYYIQSNKDISTKIVNNNQGFGEII